MSQEIAKRLETARESTPIGAKVAERAKRFGMATTLSGEPEGWAGVAYQHVTNLVQNVTPMGVPVLKPFFMFLRVPTNFYNLVINATPFGAVSAAIGSTPTGAKQDGKRVRRQFTEDEKHQLYAQAAIGTALMGYFAARAMSDDEDFGLWATGPRDPTANAQWRANGGIPYSVKIGGKLVSFQNWPIAAPLALAGHVADSLRYDDRPDHTTLDRIKDALIRFPSVLLGAPMLNGLSQLADLTNPYRPSTKKAEMFAKNTLSSTVMPRLLVQLKQAFYDDRQMDAGVVKHDSLGEPVRWTPMGRQVSDVNRSPLREWLNVKKITVPIPGRDVKIDGHPYKLTDAQYSELQRLAGTFTKQQLQSRLGYLKSLPRDHAEKEVHKIAGEQLARVRAAMKSRGEFKLVNPAAKK